MSIESIMKDFQCEIQKKSGRVFKVVYKGKHYFFSANSNEELFEKMAYNFK